MCEELRLLRFLVSGFKNNTNSLYQITIPKKFHGSQSLRVSKTNLQQQFAQGFCIADNF